MYSKGTKIWNETVSRSALLEEAPTNAHTSQRVCLV